MRNSINGHAKLIWHNYAKFDLRVCVNKLLLQCIHINITLTMVWPWPIEGTIIPLFCMFITLLFWIVPLVCLHISRDYLFYNFRLILVQQMYCSPISAIHGMFITTNEFISYLTTLLETGMTVLGFTSL